MKKKKIKRTIKGEQVEVPYTSVYKPDSPEFRKHFEESLSHRFNISPFGNKKKKDMTQGETKARENYINSLREKARRNLEEEEAQDYKDKLEKITFDIQHEKDKEIKSVRDSYIDRVDKAKGRLTEARRLAKEKGLPDIWINHNVVLEWDKNGNPAGIDAIKQMVNRVANSYDRLQKLKDDLDEIEERIHQSQKYLKKKSYKIPSVDEIQKDVDDARAGLMKGSRFTKAYTKDLYDSIENAEKYIKKSKKEDLRVEKLLRKQARELGIPYRKGKKKDTGSTIDEIMEHIKKKTGKSNIKISEED